MRCDCCNKRLNDYEASLKSAEFGVYMNTCKKCLDGLNIETVGRDELSPQSIVEDIMEDTMYDYVEEDAMMHAILFDSYKEFE